MNLHLTAPFRPIEFPEGAICKPLPRLKTLELWVQQWPIGGPTCITAFAAAPELREIKLVRMSLSQISLPWTQITRLTLSYQSLEQIFEILRQTPNVEDLTVSFNDHSVVQLSPFTLPHLRRIKLSSALILNNLILPALESLELACGRAMERASVQSFLQRSECAIRVFQLDMTDMQNACDCLSDLPSVTDVTIKYADWSTDDFTRFFNWLSGSENRTVLPALEMLYIHGATGNIEVGAMETFLSSRRTSAGGRRKLKLFKLLFSYKNCPDFQVERTLKNLTNLRTGGLQIDITQAHKWTTDYIDSKMVGYVFLAVSGHSRGF
ncbi:C3H1-type domain-containing protein [Mycena sanguinolenta]|uniref:C3H1-type domain-containing protein n=1 Tax=Mycena sanguinolenta TaxID=230812 RepID=A0A8H7CNW9_9AGAR|nr:C3H1-type domain-containing protein [Mycena sanguinolenta]